MPSPAVPDTWQPIWHRPVSYTHLDVYKRQGQAYELAIFEAQQYSDEIKKLEGAYKRGEYSSTEYQEKLQDLTDKQWESIKAAEKAKEGIIDLNKARVDAAKKGIEKEIKATEELIDKKKEALDIEKEGCV